MKTAPIGVNININNKTAKKINFSGALQAVQKKDVVIKQMTNLFDNFSNTSSKPLFQINNDSFIKKLSNKLTRNPNAPIKFGITGESGSGKSTFVQLISSILKKEHDLPASTIYRDNYLKDYSDKAILHGGANNYTMTGALDKPQSIDFKKIISDIDDLENGRTIFPKKRQRETGVVIEHDYANPIQPSQFIFSEGIGLFTSKKYRDKQDILIYAEAPAEVIKQRWFDRASSRGKTGDVAKVCYEVAKEQAKSYTIPFKKVADLIVDTEAPMSLPVRFINDFVALLKSIRDGNIFLVG